MSNSCVTYTKQINLSNFQNCDLKIPHVRYVKVNNRLSRPEHALKITYWGQSTYVKNSTCLIQLRPEHILNTIHVISNLSHR